MQSPFFYIRAYDPSKKEVLLDEDTSRHIVQVLRMKAGEKLHLTDGKGMRITAHVISDHKKNCLVGAETTAYEPPATRAITIAISLLKNTDRFEWFLEKATEIGISEIIPLVCERTIKEKFRHERLNGICISAMLQSQQCWLPVLHEPIAYELLFRQEEIAGKSRKFIAHCEEGDKNQLLGLPGGQSAIILVGPEGDFSAVEIELASKMNFLPVSLGNTRLRAETAGVVAAALLKLA